MEGALWTIDWVSMFMPTRSLLEMVVRATIMYFVVVLLLKAVVKRQTGGVGPTDILVIVLIAEIAPASPPIIPRLSKARCWSPLSCSGASRSSG